MNNVKIKEEDIFRKAIPQLVHDIRNPLNIIVGFSSIIQLEPSVSSEVLAYLKKISQSGMYIEQLLSNVDYYVMDNIEIEESKCEIGDIITNFFDLKSESLKKKNKSRLEKNFEEKIITTISIDIFNRILENLFQFSTKGFNTVKVRNIQVVLIKEDGYIAMYCSDTTEPVSIQNDYFEFEDVLSARRGLGLEFNKKFLKIFNGSIEYKFAKNWHFVQENLKIDFFANHGFIIKIPIK